MDMVKLGKTGRVSIPKSVLKRLGIEGEVTLSVETTADGAIVLRPADIYPIEIYSDARAQEFAEADKMKPALARKAAGLLGRDR